MTFNLELLIKSKMQNSNVKTTPNQNPANFGESKNKNKKRQGGAIIDDFSPPIKKTKQDEHLNSESEEDIVKTKQDSKPQTLTQMIPVSSVTGYALAATSGPGDAISAEVEAVKKDIAQVKIDLEEAKIDLKDVKTELKHAEEQKKEDLIKKEMICRETIVSFNNTIVSLNNTIVSLNNMLVELRKEKNIILSNLKDKINLSEFDLAKSLSDEEDFPESGGGSVLFKRSRLVKRTVDTFIKSKEAKPKFSSYYFRHSAGTGKTVLMKLLGKELQDRGFAVFMLLAPALEKYPTEYFKNLVIKFGLEGKSVAILVDEVQNNVFSLHWDYLLKNAPGNLLVVGTGIPYLAINSPQFSVKIPSPARQFFIGQLTEEDMEEVLDHFIPKGSSLLKQKIQALNELLVATGGQVYPFVIIAKHLLNPEREEKLANVSTYLTSEIFFASDSYDQVRRRCFSFNKETVDTLAPLLLEKEGSKIESSEAYKTGLWDGNKFVSPLLVQELFRQLISSYSPNFEIKLHDSSPIVEQVIVAGLFNMTPRDFEEPNFNTLNNERGLAFRWGVCSGAALKDQLWLASEVVTEEKKDTSGAKPTIDFVVNGHHNIGIEVAKDRAPGTIVEKLEKIGSKGVYKRHDSYIFHFTFDRTQKRVIKQMKNLSAAEQSRIYTFIHDDNILMRGDTVVREGVVRRLPRPPSRTTPVESW